MQNYALNVFQTKVMMIFQVAYNLYEIYFQNSFLAKLLQHINEPLNHLINTTLGLHKTMAIHYITQIKTWAPILWPYASRPTTNT